MLKTMSRGNYAYILACLACLLLCRNAMAQAQVYDNSWINPAGGSWEDNSNWTPSGPADGYLGFDLNSPGYVITMSKPHGGTLIVDSDNPTINLNSNELEVFGIQVATSAGQSGSLTLQGPGTIFPDGPVFVDVGASGKLVLSGVNYSVGGDGTTFDFPGTLEIDNGSFTGDGEISRGTFGGNLQMNNGQLSDQLVFSAVSFNSVVLTNGSAANFDGGFKAQTVNLNDSSIASESSGDAESVSSFTLANHSSFYSAASFSFNTLSVSGDSQVDAFNINLGSSATIELNRGMQPAVLAVVSLTLSGDLTLTLGPGLVPVIGDQFDLLKTDFGPLTGTFSSIELPPTGTGVWDTSQLYTTGVLSVVPEPTSITLLAFGGAALLMRRRSGKKIG